MGSVCVYAILYLKLGELASNAPPSTGRGPNNAPGGRQSQDRSYGKARCNILMYLIVILSVWLPAAGVSITFLITSDPKYLDLSELLLFVYWTAFPICQGVFSKEKLGKLKACSNRVDPQGTVSSAESAAPFSTGPSHIAQSTTIISSTDSPLFDLSSLAAFHLPHSSANMFTIVSHPESRVSSDYSLPQLSPVSEKSRESFDSDSRCSVPISTIGVKSIPTSDDVKLLRRQSSRWAYARQGVLRLISMTSTKSGGAESNASSVYPRSSLSRASNASNDSQRSNVSKATPLKVFKKRSILNSVTRTRSLPPETLKESEQVPLLMRKKSLPTLPGSTVDLSSSAPNSPMETQPHNNPLVNSIMLENTKVASPPKMKSPHSDKILVVHELSASNDEELISSDEVNKPKHRVIKPTYIKIFSPPNSPDRPNTPNRQISTDSPGTLPPTPNSTSSLTSPSLQRVSRGANSPHFPSRRPNRSPQIQRYSRQSNTTNVSIPSPLVTPRQSHASKAHSPHTPRRKNSSSCNSGMSSMSRRSIFNRMLRTMSNDSSAQSNPESFTDLASLMSESSL